LGILSCKEGQGPVFQKGDRGQLSANLEEKRKTPAQEGKGEEHRGKVLKKNQLDLGKPALTEGKKTVLDKKRRGGVLIQSMGEKSRKRKKFVVGGDHEKPLVPAWGRTCFLRRGRRRDRAQKRGVRRSLGGKR